MKLFGRIFTSKHLILVSGYDIYHIWTVNSKITQSATSLQRHKLIAATNFFSSAALLHDSVLTQASAELVEAVKAENAEKVIAANARLEMRFAELGYEPNVDNDSRG